jgi:hypothetical protein
LTLKFIGKFAYFWVKKEFFSSLLGGMTTPQQFLESFFKEKAAAYAGANVLLRPVHAKYFVEPLSNHAADFQMPERVREVVEDVKQSVDSAIVITRLSTESDVVFRQRYHLSKVGDSWKIVRLNWQCLLCHGTGRLGTMVCQKCDGEGWYGHRKNAA